MDVFFYHVKTISENDHIESVEVGKHTDNGLISIAYRRYACFECYYVDITFVSVCMEVVSIRIVFDQSNTELAIVFDKGAFPIHMRIMPSDNSIVWFDACDIPKYTKAICYEIGRSYPMADGMLEYVPMDFRTDIMRAFGV